MDALSAMQRACGVKPVQQANIQPGMKVLVPCSAFQRQTGTLCDMLVVEGE